MIGATLAGFVGQDIDGELSALEKLHAIFIIIKVAADSACLPHAALFSLAKSDLPPSTWSAVR